MAWIQTDSEATSRLYDAELDVAVEFSDNATAQCDADVAEQFIEKYEAISAYDGDADG